MNSYTELAQAIRKGAAIRPQATVGMYFAPLYQEHEPDCASCVLAAAWEGTVGPFARWEVAEFDENGLRGAYPCLNEPAPPCPVAECSGMDFYSFRGSTLVDRLNHLNERHKWTRDAIADFIDSLAAPERRTATPTERH